MPVDLSVSKHVIESFLAGSKLKEDREERIARAEAQKEALELRRQQIADLAAQFQERHKLETAKALSNFELNKARIKDYGIRSQLGVVNAAAAASGKLKTPDGQSIDIGTLLQLPEYKNLGINVPSMQEASQQEIIKQTGIAQGREDVAAPGRAEDIRLRGNVQAGNINLKSELDAEQKKLDRENRIEVAKIRALNSQANKQATKEEKDNDIQDYVGAVGPKVFNWETTREELIPQGTSGGLKIHGQINKLGKVANKQDIIDVKLLNNIGTIMDKAEQLNTELQKGSVISNSTNAKVAALTTDLNTELETWGRAVKNQKGSMTDRDAPRIAGGFPQVNPLGEGLAASAKAILNPKAVKEANDRRVLSMKKLYKEKLNIILKGTTPEQRKAIMEQYGLREINLEPSVGSKIKNSAGEEVERVK